MELVLKTYLRTNNYHVVVCAKNFVYILDGKTLENFLEVDFISISISFYIKSLSTMVYCICQAANDRHYLRLL